MPRVLIVEDNTDLAAGLEYNLRREELDVRVAPDGGTGLTLARSWAPDLIILDLMLPDLDGYQVLERVRRDGSAVPVIILTARAEEASKVRGFRLDADQYVTKPFGLLELIERVKSQLRRAAARNGQAAGGEIRFGDVLVRPASRSVTRAGSPVALTPKAYELLMALVRRNGVVAHRVELLKEIWGHRGLVLTRTVDSHVAELRRKLEDDPTRPRHILTVWKAGYRFQP